MSSSTTNLGLTKLTTGENFSNSVLNANWDKIDAFAGGIEFGTSSKTLDQNLADNWTTVIPNDGKPHLVRINAMYGVCVGFMTRYSNSYGSGCLTRYEGSIYRVALDNGVVYSGTLALNSQIASDWTGCADYKETIESSANVVLQSFGKMRILTFQGATRTHTEDELLMTLPATHRPLASNNIYAAGSIGSTPVTVRLNGSDGRVTLFIANGATANARLYFQMVWVAA